MADLTVNLAGVPLKNPILTASGTFGFGEEYTPYMDVSSLGGIGLKALTPYKKLGNPTPRVVETASGMLNSVGLQNPGVEAFKHSILPRLTSLSTQLIANVAGACIEDYLKVIEALNDTEIALYELNISCPNVKKGGVQFGTDPMSAYEITQQAKKVAKKPLFVKLTPNVTSIAEMAKAVEEAGADGVSLINTLTGMAIDPVKRKPRLANVVGGLSGPCIKPVALRMVYQVAQAVSIPIIGMGGIMCGQDVAEFMIAGASAVMVGTASIASPDAPYRILREFEAFLEEQNIGSARELVGTLQVG